MALRIIFHKYGGEELMLEKHVTFSQCISCILRLSKFYLPTDAQLNFLKTIINLH
jgi:dTDP-4-dehydrorhamnose reductase